MYTRLGFSGCTHPIKRAMVGWSEGKSTLNDSSPPTTTDKYACHSNTEYSTLPAYVKRVQRSWGKRTTAQNTARSREAHAYP